MTLDRPDSILKPSTGSSGAVGEILWIDRLPIFPQNSLAPADENRYRKFKIVVGILAGAGILIILGAIVGGYYLVSWLLGA